jgi:hypothetical protein
VEVVVSEEENGGAGHVRRAAEPDTGVAVRC